MSIVSEIIYIVPEEREQYLKEHIVPSPEIQRILWQHGIRNQYYFELNELILRSYEYVGGHYYRDMGALAADPVTRDFFVQKRRKDVPEALRKTTNWWAPLKRQGRTLAENPFAEQEPDFDDEDEQAQALLSGGMVQSAVADAFRYAEEEWDEALYI